MSIGRMLSGTTFFGRTRLGLPEDYIRVFGLRAKPERLWIQPVSWNAFLGAGDGCSGGEFLGDKERGHAYSGRRTGDRSA